MGSAFVEQIFHSHPDGGEGLLAIIVYARFDAPGITFFTDATMGQQVAYMRHPAGHVVAPHSHRVYPRTVYRMQEVLCVRNGSMRVDFYTSDGKPFESRVVGAGDTVILIGGGHGMECLDEVEMVEVKQGPFGGAADKIQLRDRDAGV